jgi:hypothetical protein
MSKFNFKDRSGSQSFDPEFRDSLSEVDVNRLEEKRVQQKESYTSDNRIMIDRIIKKVQTL